MNCVFAFLFYYFFLILQMSGVQELFFSRLPDEQPGECLTSHAVCIPQTLISDISRAVNDGRVSFLFFFFPFVQDMLIIQTRLLLPSFPTPLTWWPPKCLEGQKGRQEGPHKGKKTRKCSERLQQDAASLICALCHPHPKGSSSSWPWWQVPVSHCAFHPYRFRLAREPQHCHQHLFHYDSWHCLTRAEITFFGFGFLFFF